MTKAIIFAVLACWAFVAAIWVAAAFIHTEIVGSITGAMGHKWRKVRGRWQWVIDPELCERMKRERERKEKQYARDGLSDGMEKRPARLPGLDVPAQADTATPGSDED